MIYTVFILGFLLLVDVESEPEVSSSSEQTQSASSQNSAAPAKSTLEPFIVLTRCDSPKTEVSSSTAGDDIIDLIEEEKTDVSTPKLTSDTESSKHKGSGAASGVQRNKHLKQDSEATDERSEPADSGLGSSEHCQESHAPTKLERTQTPVENVSVLFVHT